MTWLAADLAKHRKAKGTVVFLHQPLWYQWANWAPVHKLLREHGVRAVIAGHFHYNQDEGELDGVRYLVIGATGGMTKKGAGEVHHVTLLKLDGRRLDLELIPLRGDAQTFSSRRDMDRVQALAVTLSNLYADVTVDTCAGKTEVQLRSLGNPIDVPLRLRVTPSIAVEGAYASVCGKGPDCILPPGLLIQSSNNSSVTPERTEAIWKAKLPSAKLQLKVRAEFDGERQPLYIEQDFTARANCPVK